MRNEAVELCRSIIGEEFDRIIADTMKGWAEAKHKNRGSGLAVSQLGKIISSNFDSGIANSFNRVAKEVPISARSPYEEFWSFVKGEIMARAKAALASLQATVCSAVDATLRTPAIRMFGQQEPRLHGIVHRSYTQSLSKDQLSKDTTTPPDPSSPDVAVMMWFPNAETYPGEFREAQARYDLVSKIIAEVSQGKMRVRKYNDPDVVAKDRISSDVERWLEDAKLVITDLTGLRPDVFYEFGYARGTGTQTLSICPKDDLARLSTHIRSFQQVVYKDLSDLESQLKPKVTAWFNALKTER